MKDVNLEKIVSVRVTEQLHLLIGNICKNRGEDISDFVRRAVLKELAELSFLPSEQKKALGVAAK